MSAPDRTPRALIFVGWIAAAGVVALGEASPLRVGGPMGPPAGQLAAGLPMLPPEVFPSPPRPAPPARVAVRPAPPRPARGRLLAEVAAAFAGRDTGAARARRLRLAPENLLPRPLAEFRMAVSPLIMPRLSLPRVLSPDFPALRGLAARARPNQPVQVRLTAYCLSGTTRLGNTVRPGIVAADPRIFPLARHVELYAAGRHLGRFRVDDTGGAVRGPHIDIWTPDCADARRFGSRPGVAALVAVGRQ